MRSKLACLSGTALVLFCWDCTPTKMISKDVEEAPEAKLVDLGNGICQNAASGLMWTIKKSDFFSNREEAEAYADNLEYAGYADWRLPTRNELYRLHELYYWKKNGSCRMRITGSYWSGGPGEKAAAGYWETYYLCSPEFKFIETPGKGMVRAVRP